MHVRTRPRVSFGKGRFEVYWGNNIRDLKLSLNLECIYFDVPVESDNTLTQYNTSKSALLRYKAFAADLHRGFDAFKKALTLLFIITSFRLKGHMHIKKLSLAIMAFAISATV